MQDRYGSVSQGGVEIWNTLLVTLGKNFLATSELRSHLEGTLLGEYGHSSSSHSLEWYSGGAEGVGAETSRALH